MLLSLVQISTILGVLIALAMFTKGIIEYSRQNKMKRAEYFISMRKRLKDDSRLSNMIELIHKKDSKLIDKELFEDKLYLTGFFEEIALLMNSKLIKPEITHYMFGYYAIRCWECDLFWTGLNRNTPYWSILRDFVSQMKKSELNLKNKNITYEL
jgi:hypothetical protein